MRGTDYGAVNDEAIEGIIPACAGNSSYAQLCRFRLWDHPRVCGEQDIINFERRSYVGSSPRVRGTAKLQKEHREEFGIIPACAGNSLTVR